MTPAEELAHLESAIKFASWHSASCWKHHIILFDIELGIYFGGRK